MKGFAAGVAGAAVALVPLWSHVTLVDSSLYGIIAVFREVGLYPSDGCLVVLAAMAIRRPAALDSRSRKLATGLALLAAVALASAFVAQNRVLAGGLAGHLALLTLAWLGVRSVRPSPTLLLTALVTSAVLQSALAAAQFISQQTLVPPALQLPWLPSDVSQDGTPVILNVAGDRLLRGFGTFPHPNVLGGYLAMALVCLPLLAQRLPWRTPLWWLVGITLSVGLLASFSRAAWLAAIVGLSAWWWARAHARRAGWWLPPIVGLVVLSAIGLSPVAPTVAERLSPLGPGANALERGSIENRLALDQGAFVEINDHWPQGLGGANYGLVVVAEGHQEGWGEPAPNLALLITAELGLPGAIAIALVVLGTVPALVVGRAINVPLSSAFLALIVLAMLDHYLWTMPLGRVIAWTPFALLAAVSTKTMTKAED